LEDQVLGYVDPFEEVLAAFIAWAFCSSYHRMLEATPAHQWVFGQHDMVIYNIKMVDNWFSPPEEVVKATWTFKLICQVSSVWHRVDRKRPRYPLLPSRGTEPC
jgi:hypothetical protein